MKYKIQAGDYERELKVARIAEKAAEAVHCAFAAKAEADEIDWIIGAQHWDSMFSCLQAYIRKYREFIMGLSPFTNITVENLTKEKVASLTVDDLTAQLRIMKGFIYAHHAIFGLASQTFKECFEKMMRKAMIRK